MTVSYTISPQEKVEDGERYDTLYQCPVCGIAYDIDKNLSWGYQVTDNCESHKKDTD